MYKRQGSGLLFVDDIRLYREAPEAVAPADPGTTGLAAYYQMEGNVQDSSGNNRNGTAFNDPTYAAAPTGFGQAIQFDGFADYVELPIGSVIASAQSLTISTPSSSLSTKTTISAGWLAVWPNALTACWRRT